uniref:Uncharacterized protein n=1 Tax=Arundo donax TaxID=35708 RepID=A0A0A9FWT7_ARUDO
MIQLDFTRRNSSKGFIQLNLL